MKRRAIYYVKWIKKWPFTTNTPSVFSSWAEISVLLRISDIDSNIPLYRILNILKCKNWYWFESLNVFPVLVIDNILTIGHLGMSYSSFISSGVRYLSELPWK